VAAACSGPGDEEVATVDGHVITVGDVSDLFSTENIPIDNGFRLAAFRLVAIDVLERGYEQDFDTEVDDAVVAEQYEAFLADLAAQELTVEEVVGIADATVNMIQFDARLTVIRDGVIFELAQDPVLIEGLLANLAADPALLATVCVRHILTSTEEEAQDVLTRLEAGEDFATVADEVSTDSSSGGDLGCSAPSRYVVSFADATMEADVGVLYGPIQSEFGYHVLIVDERDVPTAADVEADPGAFLPSDQLQTLWIDWINARLGESEITVNPKFGVWDTTTLRIVAPPAE
ncbi:MAG: peptidylprolyl isomerase, partial [Acidimicrobiia bacterium]|nr:peptidylprolyl isomerase [Acidimicrobiia bacterium]